MASSLASLPAPVRRRILASLTKEERERLEFLWAFWARPSQLPPPGTWRTWLICAGRAYGKTRTGAEYVRAAVEEGTAGRVALVGATAADTRDVIVEGESGLLAVCPPWNRPVYEPSKRRVSWANGAIATLYSADEPDRLRGPQHDLGWADELAAWRYPETWDQLQFGLRLGTDPRVIVTTTPRPTAIVKALIASRTTHVTRGSTYENRANLPAAFFEQIIAKYEGTRLGRQELLAEILDDNPGALFQQRDIERARVRKHPLLLRIVVAIDPAISTGENADETGIIVVALGVDLHCYVLADLSGIYTPNAWARRAIAAYEAYGASCIVAEVNQGGDLVVANLRGVDPRVRVKAVRASRGKRTRAEPIASLYEQGRVHHVGVLAKLEDQMVTWDPSLLSQDSPDRMDALVWGVSELVLEARPVRRNFDNLPPG